MTDVFPPEVRRRVMSRIRGKGTKPEREIMALLDEMGVRYEYQAKVGRWTVDFLIPDRRLVIEYRSCFWHGHSCPKGRLPKGGILGREWWRRKIERNRERDRRRDEELRAMGYRVEVIWGCEDIRRRLEEILGAEGPCASSTP